MPRLILFACAAMVCFLLGSNHSRGAHEDGKATAGLVGGTVTPDVSPSASLVSEALRRLRAIAVGKQRTYAILIQSGAGEKAEAACLALKDTLGKDARFALSTVRRVNEAPVADINSPGQHVHPVSFLIEPPPDLVVRVWESENRLIIAAREPGGDPLGPPDRPWLWVLESPRQ